MAEQTLNPSDSGQHQCKHQCADSRSVAQPGSALVSGSRGRRFESCRSDHLRFFEKVVISEGGCWLWQASGDRDGYGIVQWGDRLQRAHRVAYALSYGDPGASYVLHTCDTPACVNPAHLRLGDHADNMADMVAKGRHGSLKYSPETVARVFTLAADGLSHRQIANDTGISKGHVGKLLRGERR
jgi:hypothetical protein